MLTAVKPTAAIAEIDSILAEYANLPNVIEERDYIPAFNKAKAAAEAVEGGEWAVSVADLALEAHTGNLVINIVAFHNVLLDMRNYLKNI